MPAKTPIEELPNSVVHICKQSLKLFGDIFYTLILPIALLSTVATLKATGLAQIGALNLVLWILSILGGYTIFLMTVLMAQSSWQAVPYSLAEIWKKISARLLIQSLLLTLRLTIIACLWMLLLIVPGLVYFMNRTLAYYILCLERCPISEALERSKRLMLQDPWYAWHGPWCRISGLFLILFVISALPSIGLALVLGLLMGLGTFANVLSLVITFLSTILLNAISILGSVVMVGFYNDLVLRHKAGPPAKV